MEDPPEDTIKYYLEQHFAKCNNSTEQERDPLIARHIEVLGTRFLDASYITQIFEREKFEEGKQVWEDYISDCVRANSRAVKEFTNKFDDRLLTKF